MKKEDSGLSEKSQISSRTYLKMASYLRSPMAFPMRSGLSNRSASECSQGDEGNDSQNPRKHYHRHTSHQIQRLEGFFKKCAHPNEKQRRRLGTELGLEPRQIKFWFQNKRTQAKAQNERADNITLRNENDRIRHENAAIEGALKSRTCRPCGPCGGAPVTEEEIMEKLEQEHTELMCEYVRVASITAKYMGRLVSRPTFNRPGTVTAGLTSESPAFSPENLGMADQMKASPELEKLLMTEIAASAMDELIKLLRIDRRLGIKSPTKETHVLDYESYYKIVSIPKGFRGHNPRMESSKDSGVIAMDARLLVDLYLDPDKWVEFFPTVFSKANTIRVVRAGLLENRSDSLQLIHEQMQILSPLMQQREFYLLRYCQLIETGTWVIVDVSYDCLRGASHVSPTFCWKHPSGCMIEEMPNGLSRVTYVERIEVDDNLVHSIYEDLVKSNLAFGAKRWISTLQRTCERYSFLKEADGLDDELGIGRRSMAILASKMIKSYCSIFCFRTSNFRQLSEQTNNRVQIAVRKNTCSDEPVGTVIQAATSFWVPASPERVFSYLNDHLMRSQWDVFCNGSQVCKVLQIPTGHHPSNAISILQPKNSCEDLMIFQESMVGEIESLIVYAPVDTSSLLELATGVGSPIVPILASGFAITPDGPDGRDAPSTSTSKPRLTGSVVTAAFQILACTSLSDKELNLGLVPKADAFISRAVRVIQTVFD